MRRGRNLTALLFIKSSAPGYPNVRTWAWPSLMLLVTARTRVPEQGMLHTADASWGDHKCVWQVFVA